MLVVVVVVVTEMMMMMMIDDQSDVCEEGGRADQGENCCIKKEWKCPM